MLDQAAEIGTARPVEWRQAAAMRLPFEDGAFDGGAATVKDLDLRDGVIDMDVATSAKRGFFGIQFRTDSVNGEFVYLRQHKSGLPDAMQYTPVLNTGLNWQLYSGPGFIGPVDIPRDAWFHLRLAIAGASAKLYVATRPSPRSTCPTSRAAASAVSWP